MFLIVIDMHGEIHAARHGLNGYCRTAGAPPACLSSASTIRSINYSRSASSPTRSPQPENTEDEQVGKNFSSPPKAPANTAVVSCKHF